jgi:hypothetical protein
LAGPTTPIVLESKFLLEVASVIIWEYDPGIDNLELKVDTVLLLKKSPNYLAVLLFDNF